jgi:hypothetical protein
VSLLLVTNDYRRLSVASGRINSPATQKGRSTEHRDASIPGDALVASGLEHLIASKAEERAPRIISALSVIRYLSVVCGPGDLVPPRYRGRAQTGMLQLCRNVLMAPLREADATQCGVSDSSSSIWLSTRL